MPHQERPKAALLPKKRARCHQCGYRIRNQKAGIRLLDNDYHRPCLEKAFGKMDIHIELTRMGLDQPPPAAA